MTDTTNSAGVSEKEIEAHKARYITSPSRPALLVMLASGRANRARTLGSLVITLAVVAVAWVLLSLVGIPAVVDMLDLVFRGSHAANRNGLSHTQDPVAAVSAFAGIYVICSGLGQLRRWIYRGAPQRLVEPGTHNAVDLEAELGREHRDLLIRLRDRSEAPHRDPNVGSICVTSRRLLWDLAVAARVHRQLTLDTISRPDLTVGHDPRPKLLEDLQEQIAFLAAVLDTGLSSPGRCMCAQPTWRPEEQLLAAAQRAAALIPDRRQGAWAGQR